jgi:outer membrane protein assembly factor BamA
VLSLKAHNNSQDTVKSKPKTGWNFGVLPALGYDSNLGLLYGGIVNLFDYGNGEKYPDYNHNIYMQLSAYTKGSMDAILYFDSYTLIPNKHFTGRLSYNRNRAYPFYGFNGNQTIYNSNFEIKEEPDFISQVYYKMDRELIKADAILQDKIGNSDFNWLAGIDFAFYNTGTVDINHLNKGKDAEDSIPDVAGLYDNYVDWGFINDKEKDGGFDNSLKLGLVYDTRDRLTNPMKGVWTEFIARTAPTFLGNNENYMRLSLIHRQYFTVVDEKLSFAYRLWYDATLGTVPFFARQYLTASNYYEGMGGANTIRGVLMNRIIGKQTAIANIELRWKAARFQLMNQNFYLGFNAFSDAGYIIEGYDMDLSKVPPVLSSLYFNRSYKELVNTAGLGLKLAMNENFVVSAEYAQSFNKNYGSNGFYVLIGYLF